LFLTPPPPPRSTLFPYTTLFRSLVHQPPDSGQAKPQTPRRREPGLEGAGNVWDTRSFVVGRDNDPAGFSLLDEFQDDFAALGVRSEEHTSELQSRGHLVCRLLLE